MISLRTAAFAAILGAAGLLSACETTSLSAKSGPDAVVQNSKQGACGRVQNQRSTCDDQVGCYWDNEAGQCTAH